MIHTSAKAAPMRPDLKERRKVVAPPDLNGFVALFHETFQSASATYLDALTSFTLDPRESLQMLGMRFNLIALPLEGAKLVTSKTLALSFMKHLRDIVRRRTISKMEREGEERA